eukprot:1332353-Amorphochlora_amoeboformis.AAC.1
MATSIRYSYASYSSFLPTKPLVSKVTWVPRSLGFRGHLGSEVTWIPRSLGFRSFGWLTSHGLHSVVNVYLSVSVTKLQLPECSFSYRVQLAI